MLKPVLTSVGDGTKKDVGQLVTTVRGVPSAQYQPDGMITYEYALPIYFGDNIYNLDGTDQYLDNAVLPGSTAKYFGIVQNDGNSSDSFKVIATAGNNGWQVTYFDMLTNSDITAQITGVGWSVGPLAAGAQIGYRIEVKPSSALGGGESIELIITTTSLNDPTKKDVVKVHNIT